jgi:hypothetical protein
MVFWPIAIIAAVSAIGQEATVPPPGDLPVSLQRIRLALAQPPPLVDDSTVTPTFRVLVREEQRFQELLDLLDFGEEPRIPGGLTAFEQRRVLGNPWVGQPLILIDVLPMLNAGVQAIGKARRARAERAAREEVQQALVEFCALQGCSP